MVRHVARTRQQRPMPPPCVFGSRRVNGVHTAHTNASLSGRGELIITENSVARCVAARRVIRSAGVGKPRRQRKINSVTTGNQGRSASFRSQARRLRAASAVADGRQAAATRVKMQRKRAAKRACAQNQYGSSGGQLHARKAAGVIIVQLSRILNVLNVQLNRDTRDHPRTEENNLISVITE